MYSIIEKVIFLQGVSIFAEVRTDDLRHLAAVAEEVTVLPQCHIYEVNENADAFYLIADGKVRLHRDGEEIEIRGQGEAIGEWALFDDQPRLVTATALEETHLLKVTRDDFYDLLSDHERITESLLKALANRLRALVPSKKS